MNTYNDYLTRAFTEVPALTYLLGLEPFHISQQDDYGNYETWSDFIISNTMENFRKSTKSFVATQNHSTLHTENRLVINSIITNTYIQSLSTARKFLSKNIAINVSQITKYTTSMGYFELCSKNIICNKDSFLPIIQNNDSFNNQRTTKDYPVLKISKEFKEKIEKEYASAIRSQDAKLRINMKAMCFDDNKSLYNSYINHALHWIDSTNNDFSIYNTDIVFTILSHFRKLDSSLKSFFSYIEKDNMQIKEQRRLTRNLYKNFINTYKLAFADILSTDSSEAMMDKYLHNYELEHLFHLQLLPQLLEIRNIISSYYPNIEAFLQNEIDNLLIQCTSLPNSFTRIFLVCGILKEYFGIELSYNHLGILKDTGVFEKKDITYNLIKNAYNYLSYLAYIYFPAIEKASFYSMADTINDTSHKWEQPYTNQSISHTNNAPMFVEMVWHIKNKFLNKYLNPSLPFGNEVKDKNNYLLNPINGYIARNTNCYCINQFCYKRENSSSLTADETDFLTKFFSKTFSISTFKKNNEIIFNREYFGIPSLLACNSESVDKLVNNMTASYLYYAQESSNLFH